jgi:hypothetical protein
MTDIALAAELDVDEPYIIFVKNDDSCITALPDNSVILSPYEFEKEKSQQWTMTDDGRYHLSHEPEKVLEIRNNNFRVNTVQTMTNRDSEEIFNQEFKAQHLSDTPTVNKIICIPSNQKMILGRSLKFPEKLTLHTKNENSLNKHQWVFKRANAPLPMEIDAVRPAEFIKTHPLSPVSYQDLTDVPIVATTPTSPYRMEDEDMVNQRLIGGITNTHRRFDTTSIPRLPAPWHIICLILNILIPGLGTIAGAILSDSSGVRTAGIVCGIAQFITTPILIGWIWSVVWGLYIYSRGYESEESTYLL